MGLLLNASLESIVSERCRDVKRSLLLHHLKYMPITETLSSAQTHGKYAVGLCSAVQETRHSSDCTCLHSLIFTQQIFLPPQFPSKSRQTYRSKLMNRSSTLTLENWSLRVLVDCNNSLQQK